jgi:hypothetical protein
MSIPTPWLVTACLVLSTLGAIHSLITRRHRDTLIFTSILTTAGALLSSPSIAIPLFSLGCALALTLAFGDRESKPSFGRLECVYILIASVVACFLVLYRLGADSTALYLWEYENIQGLSNLTASKDPLPKQLLDYLRWNDAPLSGGFNSGVFGLPALLICKYVVASLFSIRIISALSLLASSALLFLFVRRGYGTTCGTIAASLIIFNEVGLTYGRYAAPVAASLCALLVSLVACFRFVRRAEIRWAALAAASLYVATLGYAPTRVVVLALLLATVIGLLCNTTLSLIRRMLAGLIFSSVLACIIAWQISEGSLSSLFQARHEQFFSMISKGGFPSELQHTEVAELLSNPNPSTVERVNLAWVLIREVTGKQFLRGISHWSAELDDMPLRLPFFDRPVEMPLLGTISLPFLIIGLPISLRSRPFWPSFAMVAWFCSTTLALLLTNRVDVHRQFLLVAPLLVWTALGGAEWLVAMRRCGKVPGYFALIAAVMLPCLLGPRWLDTLQHASVNARDVQAVRQLLHDTLGTLHVVTELQPSEELRVRIELMERFRRSQLTGKLSDGGLPNELADDRQALLHPSLPDLKKVLKAGDTVILIPAERFSKVASALVAEGAVTSNSTVGRRTAAVLKKP